MAKYNVRNNLVFHDYYSRLKTIALSVYEWKGLPDSCNARFLEDTLFKFGDAVFINDSNMGFLTLPVACSDILNVYNEPLRYTAYSTGYSREFDASECVYIRNNPLKKSTDSTIMLYAERLTELEQTILINAKAQKTPVLVRCDEKTRLSLEAIYNQYDGNKPVIFGTKALTDRPLEVLNTGAPFVVDKLREEKRNVWNECLEFLGLNTNPADKKKERLIVNEVDSNNEQIDIQSEVMLHARQEAAQRINEMFGLSVTVEKRIKKEGLTNGEVHNRTA